MNPVGMDRLRDIRLYCNKSLGDNPNLPTTRQCYLQICHMLLEQICPVKLDKTAWVMLQMRTLFTAIFGLVVTVAFDLILPKTAEPPTRSISIKTIII